MSSRREVLVLGATLAGGVLTATLTGCGGGGGGSGVVRLEADLSALLPAGAAKVGRAWSKLNGADIHPAQALFDRLAADGVDLADPAALGAGIRAAILDDFAGGRIFEVEQWVLAQTECRLCALAD